MRKAGLCCLLGLSVLLSGCVVRSYNATRDRVDQDLSAGNRGYLMGNPPAPEGERKTTRTTKVVEIELRSPLRFETRTKGEVTKPAPVEKIEDFSTEGNRGLITESETPEVAEARAAGAFEKYTIQKGDTLQKISKKFFGTTKKWMKIYELNKDVLKSPNRIIPGQSINIPVESLKEPKANLK